MNITVTPNKAYTVEPRVQVALPNPNYQSFLQNAAIVNFSFSITEANELIARLSEAVVEAQR